MITFDLLQTPKVTFFVILAVINFCYNLFKLVDNTCASFQQNYNRSRGRKRGTDTASVAATESDQK